MQTVCEKIGLNLKLNAYISWELDDLALGRVNDNMIVEKHHLSDLEKYFPGIPQKGNSDAWVDACRAMMAERQNYLHEQAKKTLGTNNLIVVGGLKVNQVTANLCHSC